MRVAASLSIWLIVSFMCIGLRAWLLEISGWSLVVVLQSFLSLSGRPFFLSPASDIGGLSCVGVVVSCVGACIGHILVAMSWYSWRIAITCAAAKSIWSVVALSSYTRAVLVCVACCLFV
jgi:hypothetical protein